MKKLLMSLSTIITLSFIALKIHLVNDGYTYLFSAWFENAVIIVGISVFAACVISTINKKIEDAFYKNVIFIIASVLNGTVAYLLEYKWLYFIYIQWNNTDVTIDVIKESELPYLFALIAISTLCATYFYLKLKLYEKRSCLTKEGDFYGCNDERR